jgi:nitrite reductase (NO-forming)
MKTHSIFKLILAGVNSIAHPAINIHGLYTDEVASEMKDNGVIPLWEVIPVVAGILAEQ